MSHLKQATLHIKGMHCPSCDILIQDKFCEVANVKSVKANFKTQKAEVHYHGQLNKNLLNEKINQYGYQITEGNEEEKEPYSKRLLNAGALALILFIIFYLAQELNLIPQFNVSAGLSLTTIFILGLVASTSTCMATSGALFMATIGKLRDEKADWKANLIPALSFNLGRVLTYGFFGFLTGYVGKTIATDLRFGQTLTLFVAIMMVFIGLDMLKLLPFSSILSSSLTKGIFQKLERRLIKNPKKTSFFLGAITYLLPCGFTQTVQLYALGLADPVKSGLTMMLFAIGTVPALMAIGVASSFSKSSYYPWFYRVIGVVVLMIGISYFANFLALQGFSFAKNAQSGTNLNNVKIENGIQIVSMNVENFGYTPNFFTIMQGIPVKWVINGNNVFGCQGFLVAPKLGVQRALSQGENIIEFTPDEKGTISFSCAMGMYRGSFTVI